MEVNLLEMIAARYRGIKCTLLITACSITIPDLHYFTKGSVSFLRIIRRVYIPSPYLFNRSLSISIRHPLITHDIITSFPVL
jgi:hypothetical protein